MIAFVVPLQPLKTASDPDFLRKITARTFSSIMNQTNSKWVLVILSHNAPSKFGFEHIPKDQRVIWEMVDFEFGSIPENTERYRGCYNQNQLKGLRDKGRKLLWGTRIAVDLGANHIMAVDHDDLISNRLAEWCASRPDLPGWYIENGWVWKEGDRRLLEALNGAFDLVCGSSNIVNKSFFNQNTFNKDFLSPSVEECGWWIPHSYIRARLRKTSPSYAPLPFRGAVYVLHYRNLSGIGNLVLTL